MSFVLLRISCEADLHMDDSFNERGVEVVECNKFMND